MVRFAFHLPHFTSEVYLMKFLKCLKYFTKKIVCLTWTSVQGFIRQQGQKVTVVISWDALKDFLDFMVPLFLLISSCLLVKTCLQFHLGLKLISYKQLVFSPQATFTRVGQQISYFANCVLICRHLWSPKQNTVLFFPLRRYGNFLHVQVCQEKGEHAYNLKTVRTFVKPFHHRLADIFGIAEDRDFRLIHQTEEFGL